MTRSFRSGLGYLCAPDMQEYGTAMTDKPGMKGVLETVLYCDSSNEDEVRKFYTDVLGLRQIGFQFAYRVGSSDHVFLVFNRDQVSDQEVPPPHGATGPVHTCFEAEPGTYETWKDYLRSQGTEPYGEITWGNGQRSFYFDDPAGNVLEMAEGDFWPHANS